MIQQDIEGLCVGTELHALEVAPLITDGAELDLLPILHDLDRLLERCLLIDHKRDEDVVFLEHVLDVGVNPYRRLHLTAVHAAVAREVDHHGLPYLTGISHPRIVVVELRMDLTII